MAQKPAVENGAVKQVCTESSCAQFIHCCFFFCIFFQSVLLPLLIDNEEMLRRAIRRRRLWLHSALTLDCATFTFLCLGCFLGFFLGDFYHSL